MTTKTYTVEAWCVRPFIAGIEVEASTPEQAIALARNQPDRLLDSAEECTQHYLGDEFAVSDESGRELLRVLTDAAKVREAAPDLLEALEALLIRERGSLEGKYYPDRDVVAENARIAIAKARGRAA